MAVDPREPSEDPAQERSDDGPHTVIEGRAGFLFLTGDSNRVLDQHAGRLRLTDADLDAWKQVLEARVERARERGARYVFAVAPDTQSVYPEMLPAGIESVPTRPVHQLIEHLERCGSAARVIYPVDALGACKEEHLVCLREDTHWTDFGAFLAYRALLDSLGDAVQMRRITADDLVFTERTLTGDLGGKLDPPRTELVSSVLVAHYASYPVYDNCVEGIGSVLATRCEVAPATTCVLVGDSYSYALLKYLPETFGRLVLWHQPTLPDTLLNATRPDVVISVVAERGLIRVPSDERSDDQRDVEHSKRAATRIRGPYAPYGTGPDCATLSQVEAMRAHMLAAGSLRDATIVTVMAYAGLGPKDVATLRWSEVGPAALELDRRVPLLDVVAEDLRILREASAGQPDTELFVDLGSWSRWRSERYLPAARSVGMGRLRPRALRNTFVHLRLLTGASPELVGKEAGVHVSEFAIARARAAAAKLSGASPDELIRAARTAVHGAAGTPRGVS